MTLQEIFDTVSKHLLTQSLLPNLGAESCAYRGLNDLKCAIGCLIMPQFYSDHLEGKGVGRSLDVVGALVDSGVLHEYLRFYGAWIRSKERGLLMELQAIHDSYDPENWAEKLAEVKSLCHLH